MLNDPYLLRDDVELFADFGTDFYQCTAILRADARCRRQLVPHHLARQRRIEWLAPTLLTRMTRHSNTNFFFLRRQGRFGRCRRPSRLLLRCPARCR